MAGTLTDLDIENDVPQTTLGLSACSLSLQGIAFIFILIGTMICSEWTCHIVVAVAFCALSAFFYMTTAAYWADRVSANSNKNSNTMLGHCDAAELSYNQLWFRYPHGDASLDDFVKCHSFVSYWCMWVNFGIMLIMSCCLGWAASVSPAVATEGEKEKLVKTAASEMGPPLKGGRVK